MFYQEDIENLSPIESMAKSLKNIESKSGRYEQKFYFVTWDKSSKVIQASDPEWAVKYFLLEWPPNFFNTDWNTRVVDIKYIDSSYS